MIVLPLANVLLTVCHELLSYCTGIIDDIHGAAAIHNVSTSDPMDYNGHGTFVAGVIGAMCSNPDVRGLNKAVSSMACRFMDASGHGSLFDAIQCIVV